MTLLHFLRENPLLVFAVIAIALLEARRVVRTRRAQAKLNALRSSVATDASVGLFPLPPIDLYVRCQCGLGASCIDLTQLIELGWTPSKNRVVDVSPSRSWMCPSCSTSPDAKP